MPKQSDVLPVIEPITGKGFTKKFVVAESVHPKPFDTVYLTTALPAD